MRIAVLLPRGGAATPGSLATAAGVGLEHIGAVRVGEGEATVDVRLEQARPARAALDRIGPTKIVDWSWRWLKLNVGRNHGLTIGQLRKVMAAADTGPLGKINLNNTHSMIGVQDYRIAGVHERLAHAKINGYPIRPEAFAAGVGPGSPAFG